MSLRLFVQDGDVVTYFRDLYDYDEKTQVITPKVKAMHWGILRKLEDGNFEVESKLGPESKVYRHGLDVVPPNYGICYAVYRTPGSASAAATA
jgi:hypothetical protein